MPHGNKSRVRLILLVVGALLLAYGLWGLYSGKIISTWARVEYRPSAVYWITVVSLIVVGSLNLLWSLRSFRK